MRYWILCVFLAASVTAQNKKYEIQQPKGPWKVPGEIRKPTGPWQVPGEIQKPKGLQAIREETAKCRQRFAVLADALFAFDHAVLTPESKDTLETLGPMLKQKASGHPVVVEGHTDSIGDDAYNQKLSEKRAAAVRDWLVANGHLASASAKTAGFGEKRPAVSNSNPDGSDDPAGRQKNRRVEVVVDTCAR